MRKKMKPFLSLFLALTMVLSPLSSAGVFAAETEAYSDAVDTSEAIVANDEAETLPTPTVEENEENKASEEKKEEDNQVSSDLENEEEDGYTPPENEGNETDSSEELTETDVDTVDSSQMTTDEMSLVSIPVLLSDDDVESAGNNAANIHVLKEDGTEYAMFKIVDSAAVLQGDQIAITITTNNTSYSKLYFGSPSDTEKSPVWSGTQNQNGGWTFTFTIDASKGGTNVPVVLYLAGSDTWSSKVLTMTIPDMGYVAHEPGDSDPEVPGEEENPPVTEKEDEIKAIYANDEANGTKAGNDYTMFKIAKSTAKVNGDQIEITLSVSPAASGSFTYDAIYIGSKDDEVKEPLVMGVANEETGLQDYTFSLPLSAQGTEVTFVPRSASKGTFSTSSVLALTIPDFGAKTDTDDPGEEENPDQDPDPFDSEITSLEVVKDSDGAAFTMFKVTEYSLLNDGENLTITLSTTSKSFNKLYFGSIEDNPKTPVITGTSYNETGWTFTFTLPATMKNTRIPVLLGYVDESKGTNGWYVNSTGAYSLYLAIPDVEVSGQTPEPTPSPEPTPGTSLEDGIYNVPTVETGEAMFRVVNCQLISKNGQLVAQIALSGTGYDYLYMGTKEEAYVAEPSEWIPYTVKNVLNNETGEIESKYVYEIPVSNLDTPIKVASRSAKYVSQGKGEDAWINRTITISSEGIQKTGDLPTEPENPDPTPTDPTPIIPPVIDPGNNGETTKPSGNDGKADEESKYESDLSGSTSAVDSSTGLPDGVYTPDSFSWSGGTGRVKISCNKITVKNGQAYATIVFSSSSYAYVKANGRTYYGTVSGGSTSFTIPVALNKNNKILGMTTKMTAAHEIEYNIYVYLAAAAKADGTGNGTNSDVVIGVGQSNNDKLDEEAPQIIGLTYESETKLEYAQYFKIYNYQDGITLIEIDMTSDTALDPDKSEADDKDDVEDEEKTENTEEADNSIETEEDTTELTETDEEKVAELYMGNVVKYLIVPEGTEIPVGLEKEVIIVDLPVDKTYVASEEALDTMDELELLDTIRALGFEKDDCSNEEVSKAMENGDISFAGTFDEIDYKALLRAQCNLSILPSELLPREEKDTEEQEMTKKEDTEDTEEQELSVEEQTDRLQEIAEHHAMLWIPMLVDRSSDEETELGQYEWIKLYGAIFQCEDETTKLFDQAVAAFEKEDN